MKRALLLLAIIALPSSARAQTTGALSFDALTPSLARVAQVMHTTVRTNLAQAVDAMPDNEFSFKPTPEVRSFAQLVGHVINANVLYCAQANSEAVGTFIDHERMTEKALLVKALNEGLASCDRVYESTTDTNFGEPVTIPGGAMGPRHTVRGAVLTFNTAHNNEHYGNIVVYMRLKGHVPPSTANAQRQNRQ